MSLIINSYLCKRQLVSYLVHNRTNLSYREFLTEYHDLIYIASFPYISTLPFSNWKTFDDYWAHKFLDEANELIKEKKILKKSTIDILKEKINKERLQQEKYLQIYWQEVIKNYKTENLIPGATYTRKTIRKTLTKDNINPDLMFCYNILYELENTIWAYPFYKFDKNLDIYNQIINPMDLFTINLKLENNQYSNPFEFKSDMNLIFKNNEIINNIEMISLEQEIPEEVEQEECENLYQQLFLENIEPEEQFFQIESEDIELENEQKEQEIPEEVEQEYDENFQFKQQIEEYDKIQIE
ncbi:hypothetical protein C1646_756466 [Rhizophagus diaphanus]|nr:hypothetical protein C1646_756466 [Rhizophagus diaphanus] [Rhizophagus sp. MUCL 43196]